MKFEVYLHNTELKIEINYFIQGHGLEVNDRVWKYIGTVQESMDKATAVIANRLRDGVVKRPVHDNKHEADPEKMHETITNFKKTEVGYSMFGGANCKYNWGD